MPDPQGYEPMWIEVAMSDGSKRRVDVGKIIESRLAVVDIQGNLVPFKMNPVQRDFLSKIARDWNAGIPVRWLVLKSRQHGISTIVGGVINTLCAFQRNKEATIISEGPDSATDIFEKYKSFCETWRDKDHPLRRKKSNSKLIEFQGSKSKISIASVEKGIRGGTRQYFHLSEYAFWPNPDEAMTALQPSIHDVPKTICVIESTPNGDNDFKARCEDALAGEGPYKIAFYPWTMNPETETIPYDGFELDGEERKLHALGVTLNQLKWRRVQIKKLGLAKFKQEYPRTPEEAFEGSGSGIFDPALIGRAKERTRLLQGVCRRGRFDFDERYIPDGQGRFLILNERFVDDPDCPVRIYQEPIAGMKYAIGGDTGDGGGDYWAADVSAAPSGQQVATFHRKGIEAHEFACQMVCLGRYYNQAYVCIEVNRSRAAMKDVIKAGYRNTYVSHAEETIDQSPENRDGFTTTSATKKTIVEDMQTHFTMFPDRVSDYMTVCEMGTFVAVPTAGGRGTTWQASSPRYHDDLVLARAICLHALQDIGGYASPEEVRKKETVWEYVDRSLEQSIKARRKPLW